MANKLFEKGTAKLPNSGRKKGTRNKKTVAQKEAFNTVMQLLEKRMLNGDDVINSLSPARAAELYAQLLNYQKPKLSSTTNKNNDTIDGNVNITVTFADE